jgi:nucleoside-diphosphate-sugar epimerase
MKILIIGGTGLIGSYLSKNLTGHEIYTLSRSKLITNNNHFEIDLLEEKSFYLKINSQYDVIINCISYYFLKNSNLENYFQNILKLLKSNKSTIIEISSLSAYKNLSDKRNSLTNYGRKKLESENIVTKLTKNSKNNLIIYRLGAVCLKKKIDNFIFSKLNKLILGNYFFNLYKQDNCYMKISFLEDLLDHISKNVFNTSDYSKKIIFFHNINPLKSLFKFKPHLKIIKINLSITLIIISLFKKDLSLLLSYIFNFKLKIDESIGLNLYETRI